jgi:hypothetical protein
MVTDSHVAHYIAMFIVFVVAISFSIGWAKADGIKPITDKFELGYIEDYPVEQTGVVTPVAEEYDELKDLKRQVEIAKLKQQLNDLNNPPAPKQPAKKSTKQQKPSKPPIFDDCVSALVALGVPARKAKAEAQIIFDRNPNIKTVQDFITEYGKRTR